MLQCSFPTFMREGSSLAFWIVCPMASGCGLPQDRNLNLNGASAGERILLDQDIPKVAAVQPDGNFASKDLYTSIAAGNFPEW